jgi:hypothetical protein
MEAAGLSSGEYSVRDLCGAEGLGEGKEFLVTLSRASVLYKLQPGAGAKP